MDSDHESDAFTDSSRFDVVVRSRSWEWLDALSRRLHIEVQLVDPQGSPRIPASTAADTALARLVAAGVPELRPLVTAATTLRTRQSAAVHGLHISAYPLTERGEVVGAVLIANAPSPSRGGTVNPPVDLDVAAQGILQGINAYLQASPGSARVPVDDVTSLGRVLDTTAAHGTDRELVSAFSASLAFWKRVDVYGYVMTGNGTFAAEVSPPVPRQQPMPATIALGLLPAASALTALSSAQMQALGIPNGRDVLVARIPDGEFPWLIVCCGAISRPDAQRLALYVRLLDQLMRTVIAEATVKLIAAISAHLLEQRDAATDAASAALDAVIASTGMASSALKVTTAYGAPLLQVGQPEPRSGEPAGNSRLVTVRRVPNHHVLSLVLTSNEGRLITRQQRDIAEAAANLLDAWVRGVIARLHQHDRRTASRTFDDVLDRFAGQALERGSTVSVVVMLMTDAACFPGLTQQWIARIRATMRGSDIVGMLGEGEVALLLHDTTRDRAEAVAVRIVKMLETARYPSPVVATGVASRSPGAADGAGLVGEARNDAKLRATASLIHEPRSQSGEGTR